MKLTRELMKKWGIKRAAHVECVGRNVYTVSSRSRHDIDHQVDFEDETHCGCEDAELNKNKACFHVRYLRMLEEAGMLPQFSATK